MLASNEGLEEKQVALVALCVECINTFFVVFVYVNVQFLFAGRKFLLLLLDNRKCSQLDQ